MAREKLSLTLNVLLAAALAVRGQSLYHGAFPRLSSRWLAAVNGSDIDFNFNHMGSLVRRDDCPVSEATLCPDGCWKGANDVCCPVGGSACSQGKACCGTKSCVKLDGSLCCDDGDPCPPNSVCGSYQGEHACCTDSSCTALLLDGGGTTTLGSSDGTATPGHTQPLTSLPTVANTSPTSTPSVSISSSSTTTSDANTPGSSTPGISESSGMTSASASPPPNTSHQSSQEPLTTTSTIAETLPTGPSTVETSPPAETATEPSPQPPVTPAGSSPNTAGPIVVTVITTEGGSTVLSQSTIPVVVTVQGSTPPGQGISTSTVVVAPSESATATPSVGSTSWGSLAARRDRLWVKGAMALLSIILLIDCV